MKFKPLLMALGYQVRYALVAQCPQNGVLFFLHNDAAKDTERALRIWLALPAGVYMAEVHKCSDLLA
ncbi:MAG: hypothetical protein WA383_01575 [Terriglobales bacterium]